MASPTGLIVNEDIGHRAEDFELDLEVIRGLWRMEEQHFWHAARNGWIARALAEAGCHAPASILDVGCGSGAVSGELHRRGYRVVGIDTAEVLVRKAHERFPGATWVAGRVEQLSPEHGPFDALGFFDVLEHLDDPGALLRAALVHARPGALVLATVPARRDLFSVIDALSGHKLRYELGELARTFAQAGLVDVVERGIFRVLGALMMARRGRVEAPTDAEVRRQILVADTRIPIAPVNALLKLACTLERAVGFASARDKIGPTLLVVGRIPAPSRAAAAREPTKLGGPA
jgi:SAM-dependent methyltransferase